jgi:hypothetical protein
MSAPAANAPGTALCKHTTRADARFEICSIKAGMLRHMDRVKALRLCA